MYALVLLSAQGVCTHLGLRHYIAIVREFGPGVAVRCWRRPDLTVDGRWQSHRCARCAQSRCPSLCGVELAGCAGIRCSVGQARRK